MAVVIKGNLKKTASIWIVVLMMCGGFYALVNVTSAHTTVDLAGISGQPGEAWHINANGQVVGTLSPSGMYYKAFLVNPEDIDEDLQFEWFRNDGSGNNLLMQDLGSMGGWVEADAINANGQIAGTGSYDFGGTLIDQVFLLTPEDIDGDQELEWFDDSGAGVNRLMTPLLEPGGLPAPTGSDGTWCYDMNENGEPMIVGTYFLPGGSGFPFLRARNACVWSGPTGWVDLGNNGEEYSVAVVINDRGVIVGYAADSSGDEHAFVIEPKQDPLTGAFTWWEDGKDGVFDGVNDLMTYLPDFAGAPECRAQCVNNFPTIVGYGVDTMGHSHALKWEKVGGVWTMEDLSTTVPAWVDGAAYAINDKGDIAGMRNTVHDYGANERYGVPVVYSGETFHELESSGSGIAWWISPKGVVAGCINGKPAIWQPEQAPTAIFDAEVIDVNQHIVKFNASLSVDWDGAILRYDWDFGDGSPVWPSSGPVQQKMYLGVGLYTVTLTVTDNDGYTDTASYLLDLESPDNMPPAGSFAVTSIDDLYIQCEATALDTDGGSILRYWWYWGDGTMTDVPAPTNTMGHLYTDAGTYTITLRIWDNDYGIFDVSQQVTVEANQPPTGSFTYFVSALMAYCTVTASDSDGTIEMLSWDWGDGSTSQSHDPVSYTGGRVYSAPGPYTITLTIYDDDWASCVVSQDVTVVADELPVASFESTVVGATTVEFDASTSYDPDGGPLQVYAWDFGDGYTGYGPSTSHSYASVGTYTVTLALTDDEGSSNSTSGSVHFVMAPVADFTSICDGERAVWLQSSSYDPDGGQIMNWEWDFGDGSTIITGFPSIRHIYDYWGYYDVTLKAIDDEGEASSVTQSVFSDAAPIADFAWTSSVPYVVAFDAGFSWDPDGGAIWTYDWNFGDGVSEETASETISHVYAEPGPYEVTLAVRDTLDVSSTPRAMEVEAMAPPTYPPQALFTAQKSYLGVTLDASSSFDPDGGPIAEYLWDFGDYETQRTAAATISHDYWTEGTYTIMLTVTDDEGQTGTASTTLTVDAPPIPEPEQLMIELEILIMEAHDANGMPIDEKTMESLKLKVDTAFDIVSMRKSGGTSQSAEMRKSGGANILVVFISMTESYTLYGKLDGTDGWGLATRAAAIIGLLSQKTMIAGVPNYEWYYGCGPTAAGMILGYWDAHGFEGLIRGDPGPYQTPDVWNMIASKDHIDEYARGMVTEQYPDGELYDEFLSEPIPDASGWGPNDPQPHASNCIADLMHTSWSSEHLCFGQSYASNMVNGLEGYTAIAPGLGGSSDVYLGDATELHMASFTWEDLRREIDAGRPLAVTVDVNGDGDTDHLVTVIGYGEIASARVYAFHSTWDNSVCWASFEIMHKNVCYGIFSGFTFNIVDMTPTP